MKAAFNSDGTPMKGWDIMQLVKEEQGHNKILLSFSCGKDSLAAWLQLRRAGFEVIPFYMQYIPGMKFVERSIRYYENHFGVHIYRMVHPAFFRWLYHLVFLDPVRAEWVAQHQHDALFLGGIDNQAPVYDLIADMVRKAAGLPEGIFVATGVRAADSPNRRSAINQYGAINWNRRTALVVWDMLKDDLVSLLNEEGVKLPIDYKWWGRSFDGLDYRFMWGLKHYAPDDYARVLAFFPLVEAEMFRYQIGVQP